MDKMCINNLYENFFIVATYINDINSSYYDGKIFEQLFTDILKFSSQNTPILLTGDFNGRVGDSDDSFRANDKFEQQQFIPTQNTFTGLPKRRSCDTLLNSHGEKIIHLCHIFDFKILNGRNRSLLSCCPFSCYP